MELMGSRLNVMRNLCHSLESRARDAAKVIASAEKRAKESRASEAMDGSDDAPVFPTSPEPQVADHDDHDDTMVEDVDGMREMTQEEMEPYLEYEETLAIRREDKYRDDEHDEPPEEDDVAENPQDDMPPDEKEEGDVAYVASVYSVADEEVMEVDSVDVAADEPEYDSVEAYIPGSRIQEFFGSGRSVSPERLNVS